MEKIHRLLKCWLIISLICIHFDGKSQDYEAQIDSIFSSFNDINKPGAAISVVKGNEVIFKKGYGAANLEYDIPVSSSTVFHIASVSKQFTVFAILLLEKDGKLSFDDDIRKHIPEVPDFGHTITLRHLASHTSGMRDQWSLLNMAGWRFDDVITKEHILKMVERQKELNFNPGEEYYYCNTGFTLLAEVVARISGKSFGAFTKERIFEPLNMVNTLFYEDHQRIVKNRAYSYYANDNGYNKSVLSYANAGATSLFTTVEDLALWAINFTHPKIGGMEIFKKMNTLANLNNGETFGGAYGQFVGTYNGVQQIQHGGADAGYRTYFVRFPEQELSVMVFSNLAQANPRNLSYQVVDLFLDNPGEDLNEPDTETVVENYIELSTAQLKKFTAHYWNEEGSYSRHIYLKDDTLRYNRGGDNESPIVPINENTFRMVNVGDVLLYVSFPHPDTMKVVQNNDDPIYSTAYKPADYTVEELKQFTGAYFSPELETTYHFVVEGGQLVSKHQRLSDVGLSDSKEDVFHFYGNTLKFVRNEANIIQGFRVTTGRVRNLWFEKIE